MQKVTKEHVGKYVLARQSGQDLTYWGMIKGFTLGGQIVFLVMAVQPEPGTALCQIDQPKLQLFDDLVEIEVR